MWPRRRLKSVSQTGSYGKNYALAFSRVNCDGRFLNLFEVIGIGQKM